MKCWLQPRIVPPTTRRRGVPRPQCAVFRGDQDDVLDRYFRAAQLAKADVVVRITSDCPLIDPEITDKTIAAFLEMRPDYASNALVRTYPRGLDTEVMTLLPWDGPGKKRESLTSGSTSLRTSTSIRRVQALRSPQMQTTAAIAGPWILLRTWRSCRPFTRGSKASPRFCGAMFLIFSMGSRGWWS